jgi:hypothetical protein
MSIGERKETDMAARQWLVPIGALLIATVHVSGWQAETAQILWQFEAGG